MKERIIYIATIVILFIVMAISINTCQSYKHEYDTNLLCLSDSISLYKSRTGQLVATKKLYETDIKHLKYLNDSLYSTLKSLKNKNITQATQFSGVIEMPVHDTTWVYVENTASDSALLTQERFNFSDQYRLLEGTISAHRNEINMKIEKDIVNFNYTVALDKNNNIHITSTNPYVQYNEITGFTVPKTKQKRWGIGPFVGYGINLTNGRPEPQVGVGISYGLIRF